MLIMVSSPNNFKKLKKDQLDVNELYEEVMKIERFSEVMLAFAFDHLVDNERVASIHGQEC